MSLADLRKIANFRKITVFFPFLCFTPRFCHLQIFAFYRFTILPHACVRSTFCHFTVLLFYRGPLQRELRNQKIHRDPAQRDQGMFFTPNVVVCSGGFRLPGGAKP